MNDNATDTENGNGNCGRRIKPVAIDTQILYDRLKQVPEREEIAYSVLSALIDRNVQGNARSNLQSARRMLLHNDGILFGVVFNCGLVRLDDQSKAVAGRASIDKIRREARRGMKKTTSVVDFDALPNDLKIRHNTDLSVLGMLHFASKPKQMARLENKIGDVGQRLSVGRTLELFHSEKS